MVGDEVGIRVGEDMKLALGRLDLDRQRLAILTQTVLLSDMVDNSDLPFEHTVYLFSDGFNAGDVPLRGHTTDTRPSQAPISPLAFLFPFSGSAYRLGRERPCQQILDRPPTTRHAGGHRRGSLAVALWLALSTTGDRVGQRLLERLMRPHEVIVGPPPLQME
jgi:hypothetical protein